MLEINFCIQILLFAGETTVNLSYADEHRAKVAYDMLKNNFEDAVVASEMASPAPLCINDDFGEVVIEAKNIKGLVFRDNRQIIEAQRINAPGSLSNH